MSEDLIGTQLGQYQLTEVIRRGGMATVYKAYQPSLDRYVAVKVLFHNRDPQFAPRFKQEARAIAQLQHHNILPIYDYGEQDNLLYLVLQYIENGATLSDLLGQPMAPAQALRLTIHLLGALDYAHRRGIIHRDIKPANVLLPAPTWPMLADFGIAKLLNDTSQRLTVPGLIVGTAAYMAPEQATGRPIDGRTDLYATGVMLYEMVTGRVPFDADTPVAVLTMHAYEPPPPPRSIRPDLSPHVEALLLRAMAKDPDARFQSAEAMAEELERVIGLLDQSQSRDQLTELYRVGVQAFEEGRWNLAVERFSRLVAIDPDYEDAAELLEAAGAAQQRARDEARQQIDMVRQRRNSTIHEQVKSEEKPASQAFDPRTTRRLDALVEPPPAGPDGTPAAQPFAREVAGTSATNAVPAPEPARQPTTTTTRTDHETVPAGRRRMLPVVIGVVMLAIVLVVVFVILRPGAGTGTTGQPTGETAPTPATGSTSGPIAPVAGPAGTLIYTDTFGDGPDRSGLEDQLRAPDFSRGFHAPGVYHIIPRNSNQANWVFLPRLAYADFSIQIEIWDDSDTLTGEVSGGIVFRARDDDHFYAVLLDARKGQYTIRKHDGKDTVNDVVPWKESPLVAQQHDHNILRVDSTGATHTIYLNGAQLDSFNDDSYRFGMAGMIVATVDAVEPHIHFDNLQVWTSDKVLASSLEPTRTTSAGDMVLIPGGEFILGSSQKSNERAHILGLPDFYIDRTEVTNQIYAQCVTAGACTPQQSPESPEHPNYTTDGAFANYPVMQVTWVQANAFCTWAGKRLPTEAEWEKAASWWAQTGEKSVWPWGNQFDQALLNSNEADNGDTTEVGSFAPELNGTVDMAGNISEWTSSLYKDYPYNEADGREAPEDQGDRVFRGGSWAQTQGKATTFIRQYAAPNYADREIGFRCAATP